MNKKQINYIVDRVCQFFEIERDLLISKSRSSEHVFMRFHLMKLLRTKANLSLVNIGKIIGRDHSTVVHGLSEHNNLLLYDDIFRKDWNKLSTLYIEDISIGVDMMTMVFTEDEIFELSSRLLEIMQREKELQREKESILLEIMKV